MFNSYHRLIKELVEGDSGGTRMDRQIAVIFELRNFKNYYEVSLRILKGPRKDWEGENNKNKRLLDELDLSIAFPEKKL